MTDYIEITPEILIDRALRQMRNAADNLYRASEMAQDRPVRKASGLTVVLANSIEIYGARNRGQVEGALADYFDAVERREGRLHEEAVQREERWRVARIKEEQG